MNRAEYKKEGYKKNKDRRKTNRCGMCNKAIYSSSNNCRSCATKKQFKEVGHPRKGKHWDKEHRLHYSNLFSGNKHPKWIGGRVKDTKGYIKVFSPSHPYANNNKYVFEHRLVMEKHIGRVLLPTETVHHINGVVDDNRIENLMLFESCGEHSSFHKKGVKRGQ